MICQILRIKGAVPFKEEGSSNLLNQGGSPHLGSSLDIKEGEVTSVQAMTQQYFIIIIIHSDFQGQTYF